MEANDLPRCHALDGSSLRIVPAYTESGEFGEANCITITDGERTAVYVPLSRKSSGQDPSDDRHSDS